MTETFFCEDFELIHALGMRLRLESLVRGFNLEGHLLVYGRLKDVCHSSDFHRHETLGCESCFTLSHHMEVENDPSKDYFSLGTLGIIRKLSTPM